jgi:hypothetical protein
MKIIVLALTMLVSVQASYGQKWKEWFRQRKTQIEYLVNQIAAYKVYYDYLQKGYSIVKDGTRIIGDIKEGDFNLHNGYFLSLKSVNPAVKNYSRVAAILADQAALLKQFRGLITFSAESGQFSSTERQYIAALYNNLNAECLKDLGDLEMVITSGIVEMTDNERLAFIDRLYNETKEKVGFATSVSRQAAALALHRTRATSDAYVLKKLYGE